MAAAQRTFLGPEVGVNVSVKLNPALDPNALAAEYRNKRRLQIHDFLEPASAEKVHADLHELPWAMAFNDGDRRRPAKRRAPRAAGWR